MEVGAVVGIGPANVVGGTVPAQKRDCQDKQVELMTRSPHEVSGGLPAGRRAAVSFARGV